MSWPMYILQGIIFVFPLWWLATDRSLDELQKSLGLVIGPGLLALVAFINKLSPNDPPSLNGE